MKNSITETLTDIEKAQLTELLLNSNKKDFSYLIYKFLKDNNKIEDLKTNKEKRGLKRLLRGDVLKKIDSITLLRKDKHMILFLIDEINAILGRYYEI